VGGGFLLAAVAPTLAVIGLAWALPACCCGGGGGYHIVPGPPGTISGRLLLSGSPQAATVYAVSTDNQSDVSDAIRYAMTRVEPPASTYSLSVPPGFYYVIARFDSEPNSFGGYTYGVEYQQHNKANAGLATVAVSTEELVGGIDIGDWGSQDSGVRGWWLDVDGLPLIDPLQPSPDPNAIPGRQLPAGMPSSLSTTYTDTGFGVHIPVPTGWHEIKAPGLAWSSAFFANESVVSPVNLDAKGVWLSVLYGGYRCPYPDLRFVVATTAVTVMGGLETFSFEDPPPQVTAQPFGGYGLSGAALPAPGKQCLQLIFKGATRAALESNLPTIASLLSVVYFQG
jgi:hypothetical protein